MTPALKITVFISTEIRDYYYCIMVNTGGKRLMFLVLYWRGDALYICFYDVFSFKKKLM